MSLSDFALQDLGRYTREGTIPAGVDHWLFYVGRDNVHGILLELLSRVTVSEKGNMFGYDDDELNAAVWQAVEDPNVVCFWTLDKSQSGGAHEKAILASDVAKDAAAFNAHFAIITSATSQISHTKGAVLDGLVGFEGSTNWSVSGEGTFVSGKDAPGGAGYKSQNNTLMVFTDQYSVARFAAELDAEHMAAHVSGGTLGQQAAGTHA